jgi:hypothetical protein
MKPKVVLWLVMVLCVAFEQAHGMQTPPSDVGDADVWILPKAVQGEVWNKTLLTNWTDTKITLFRATGDVVQLNGKKAMYRVWTTNNWAGNHSSLDTGVVAFVDPKNDKVWLGRADTDKDFNISDFYFEDSSGFFCGRYYLFAGTFYWHKSLIAKANPGEDVDALIGRFEKNINGWWLQEQFERTPLSPHFREWYFYPHAGVSYIGATPIDHVEVADGKLRLDFTSPAYKTKGSAWLDLQTRKVLRTVESRQIQP